MLRYTEYNADTVREVRQCEVAFTWHSTEVHPPENASSPSDRYKPYLRKSRLPGVTISHPEQSDRSKITSPKRTPPQSKYLRNKAAQKGPHVTSIRLQVLSALVAYVATLLTPWRKAFAEPLNYLIHRHPEVETLTVPTFCGRLAR